MTSSDQIQVIELPQFSDNRGVFSKYFDTKNPFLKDFQIRQINHVYNPAVGIWRGLHYQIDEYTESKLFRVLKGRIQLIAFCWAKQSEHYLKTFSFDLTAGTKVVLIPRGYATGYLVLEENSEVLYLSDNINEPKAERGIRYDDPCLSIQYQIAPSTISEKDKNWKRFDTD